MKPSLSGMLRSMPTRRRGKEMMMMTMRISVMMIMMIGMMIGMVMMIVIEMVMMIEMVMIMDR